MRDPTAALLYGALALRAAGREATPSSLAQLAGFLGLPQKDPLLLAVIAALVPGPPAGREAGAGRLPAPNDETVGAEAEIPGPPAATVSSGESRAVGPGLYVYGIVRASGSGLPGQWTGIDGAPVELVDAGEFALLVHTHASGPFASDRAEVVHRWVREHDAVLARAAEVFGDVLPIAFDTIIARKGADPVELARSWVDQRAAQLRAAFQRISGFREYAVQLFWDVEKVRRHLTEADPELGRLAQEAGGESPGRAYFLQERLRQELERAMEEERVRRVETYRGLLADWAREVRLEAPRKGSSEGRRMIANFTCLLAPEEESSLAAALQAQATPWEAVRLAGPWAPYTFANAPIAAPVEAPAEG